MNGQCARVAQDDDLIACLHYVPPSVTRAINYLVKCTVPVHVEDAPAHNSAGADLLCIKYLIHPC